MAGAPRCISVVVSVPPKYCLSIAIAVSGCAFPHIKTSKAAKLSSGHVCTEMCDSAKQAMPVIPEGWK